MDLKEDLVYPLYLGTNRQTERLRSLLIYRLGGWPWAQEWRKSQAWAWLIKIKVVSAVRRIAILQRLPRWQPNSIRVCR